MIRGVFQSVVEGVIKRFSAAGRPGETIDNREYFQHYGFTSRPLAGAETIIIREGGLFVAIASDDRRYRLAVENGEVALFDDLGQIIHLKRDGVEITSPALVTITAPEVVINAETQVTMNTPLLAVSGEIRDGVRTLSGDRAIYNSHTHTDSDGDTASPPPQQM